MNHTLPILGVVSPDPNDALSLWRAMGPLTHPSFKKHIKVRAFYPGSFGWSDAGSCDAVFFHRPFMKCHLDAVEVCKDIGVPVWCDWDDDLFCVPDGNPASQVYASKEVKNRIIDIAQMADICSFSTSCLASAFMEHATLPGKQVIVIENAIDDRIWQAPTGTFNVDGPLLWRGTASHARDLDVFRPSIEKLCALYNIHWVGYKPWWAQGIYHPPREPKAYFRLLEDIAPKCVFVPLEEGPFNAAKSDIAALEATMVGAACVTNARNWKEVMVPSVDFADTVISAMGQEGSGYFLSARDYFLRFRCLTHINDRRLSAMKLLLDY